MSHTRIEIFRITDHAAPSDSRPAGERLIPKGLSDEVDTLAAACEQHARDIQTINAELPKLKKTVARARIEDSKALKEALRDDKGKDPGTKATDAAAKALKDAERFLEARRRLLKEDRDQLRQLIEDNRDAFQAKAQAAFDQETAAFNDLLAQLGDARRRRAVTANLVKWVHAFPAYRLSAGNPVAQAAGDQALQTLAAESRDGVSLRDPLSNLKGQVRS